MPRRGEERNNKGKMRKLIEGIKKKSYKKNKKKLRRKRIIRGTEEERKSL